MSVRHFSYRAVDASGQRHEGRLSSADRAAALQQLTASGLVPVELLESGPVRTDAFKPIGIPGFGRLASLHFRRRNNNATAKEWERVSQTLGQLLRAGLTVDRALGICTSLADSPGAESAARAVWERVRQGQALSEAVRAARMRVPPYYHSLVRAGEVGGTLSESLLRAAELMRSERLLRERLVSALIYPALLALVVLATLIAVVAFVLPRFDVLFVESGAVLPASTKIVLAMGRFISAYGWFLALVAAAAVAALVIYLRTTGGQMRLDRHLATARWSLGLPVSVNSARVLRTTGSLCSSGTPLPQALRIAHGAVSNSTVARAMDRVIREVQAGQSLSHALAAERLFPSLAVQMARVGEETGELPAMLIAAAETLESEAQQRTERLVGMVVPVMTIAMGIVIAALIGSVLIGLLSVNDIAF